jgi:sugar phosphate isomerase/epimerase
MLSVKFLEGRGKKMKLCLNTHNLAGSNTLDEIIDLCLKTEIGGIEFSMGYGHKHGIEFDTDSKVLREMAEKIMNVGLETVSLASYCRFDAQDEQERDRNFELAKRGIECAHAIGSGCFRFVGNDLPSFMPREDFIERVAGYMSYLSDYAEPLGVEVLLNMHGSFNYRHDVEKLIKLSNKRNCGLVYNCDNGDVVGGSLEIVLDRIGEYIKHIHMHELTEGYPYMELFRHMKRRAYKGWYSIVVDEPSLECGRFLAYYTKLAKAYHDMV